MKTERGQMDLQRGQKQEKINNNKKQWGDSQ